MRYDSVSRLSLQQIQIFLKCHRYRSFSRVAYEYNYTPSMISKTIRIIEDLLGYGLFVRKYHTLIPTQAADILAEAWRDVFSIVINGVERASMIEISGAPHIRLGVLGDSDYSGNLIWEQLRARVRPGSLEKIHWECKDMKELPALLNEDHFDLIVTTSYFMPAIDNGLNAWKVILSAPTAVFIPRGHPLFDKELTSFADFKEYPFILLDPAGYPRNYGYLVDLAKRHGFLPKVATSCINTASAKYNLNMGKGLYLANYLIASDWEDENVRRFGLFDEPYSDLLLVWKKNATKPEVAEIVAAFDDAGVRG